MASRLAKGALVLTLLLGLGLAYAYGGIILKGVGFEYLWPSLVPLVIFGTVVFSLAVLKFR
jgi:hypothetical protein